jgi:hypothetical protein
MKTDNDGWTEVAEGLPDHEGEFRVMTSIGNERHARYVGGRWHVRGATGPHEIVTRWRPPA